MSNEMEYMDIDGPEFLSTINSEIATIRTNAGNDTSSTDIFDSYKGDKIKVGNEMCVLDTNFLISKLGYLDAVLSLAEENPGSLLIILPWVVIRELDGLKSMGARSDKDAQDIPFHAREAMRFIELRLRKKSNSLRGQKMNEIFSKTMSQKNVKGDDRILDCCMYFQHMTGQKVTLLSNDRNLCIKAMVHDIESISTESVPKMEALLNRIGGKHRKTATKKWTVPQQLPEPVINTDDYVMEIDEFYPSQSNNIVDEEDYDMMIDDDDVHQEEKLVLSKLSKGTNESQWAKHKSIPEPVAYLDNDPTLVAPRKPPQKDLIYSDSNHVPIKDDRSWTSIYSPR
ncbi:hypothetical protein HPULCUR_001295 [Helicostylum pulchrum]|uniref:PIN domain-containing protein n=1 Tax=Helicostylum pulchrum TaxID=562976 RepID=A0ABP9XMA4_9FUNG